MCLGWSLYRMKQDHSSVWTTGSLQVCLEVRLMSEFPSLPFPPLCLCPCSKHRKSNGVFLRTWAFWTIYMTKYLRTATSDQHQGISLSDSRVREWGHTCWKNPSSHQGSHCRNVTRCITKPLVRGYRADSRARSLPEGCKSLCPHLEPIQGLWLVKHVSLLL